MRRLVLASAAVLALLSAGAAPATSFSDSDPHDPKLGCKAIKQVVADLNAGSETVAVYIFGRLGADIPKQISHSAASEFRELAPAAYRRPMPTILRLAGYRFYFYSHEPDEPPHVHVDKADATAKVWLESVAFARQRGFRSKERNAILSIVQEHRQAMLEAWHEYFG